MAAAASASSRCRPASLTNTSSRLACRVVRLVSWQLEPLQPLEQRRQHDVRLADRQAQVAVLLPHRADRRQAGQRAALDDLRLAVACRA